VEVGRRPSDGLYGALESGFAREPGHLSRIGRVSDGSGPGSTPSASSRSPERTTRCSNRRTTGRRSTRTEAFGLLSGPPGVRDADRVRRGFDGGDLAPLPKHFWHGRPYGDAR